MAIAQTSFAHVIPPLESGDRLTRSEFHRRYEAMPHLKKAELIEGVVFLASPVRADYHAEPHAQIMGWLATYQAQHSGVKVGDNATVGLDADNDVQPDAYLRKVAGGTSRLLESGYIEGAPELVVEVAATSASYDMHLKMHVYRRNGVQEYIVWRVLDGQLDWFALKDGVYERLEPDEDGLIHSEVFPGLRLAVPQLIEGDLAAVLAAQSA
jgi:Uma2 family endonuclease